MAPDRNGNGWWREVTGSSGYLTLLQAGGPRSVEIAGFNASDYPTAVHNAVNFDLTNSPWVAWFEGAGASRHAVLKQVNPTDGSIVRTITLPDIGGAAFTGFLDWVFAEDGFLYVLGGGTSTSGAWSKIDLSTGVVVYQTVSTIYTSDGGSLGTRSAVFTGGTLAGPQTVSVVEPLPRLTPTASETVGGVVSDLCALAGLAAGDINVSALTDTVDGFLVGRPMTARSAIEMLQRAYFFDGVESDDKIKFVKRGGAAAATVAVTELGARTAGGEYEPAVRKVRRQEVEAPRQVTVNFWNKDADYVDATEYARRLVTSAQEQAFEDLPLALSTAKAAQVAEVLLFDSHMGRNRYQWKTGAKYAYLEPTDVFALVDESGTTLSARAERKTERGLLIEWEGPAESAPVYTAAATGANVQAGAGGVSAVGATIVDLLDIPIVRSEDDDAGFYAAFSALGSAARGAALYGSSDGNAYTELGASASLTVAGTAAGTLGNWTGGNTFDEQNSVDVTLSAGMLSSVTLREVLDGANLALLGSELIQFRTATLVTGTTYTLSGLLRGRRGTEWAMGSHATGDRFVLLRTAGVIRVERPASELTLARFYRPVSFGSNLAATSTYGFTNGGAGLKPLSPVFLHGNRHIPSSNDWTVAWKRRGRVDWDLRDLVDVPLGESSESYVVEIVHPTTKNLIRTLAAVSSPSAVYASADQTTDFGGAQSTIAVRVYQISATIGRGFPGEGTFSG
jgi:hypothetical protein